MSNWCHERDMRGTSKLSISTKARAVYVCMYYLPAELDQSCLHGAVDGVEGKLVAGDDGVHELNDLVKLVLVPEKHQAHSPEGLWEGLDQQVQHSRAVLAAIEADACVLLAGPSAREHTQHQRWQAHALTRTRWPRAG